MLKNSLKNILSGCIIIFLFLGIISCSLDDPFTGDDSMKINWNQAGNKAVLNPVIGDLPDLYKNCYTITIKQDTSKVLDTSLSSKNIYAHAYHGASNQQFLVIPVIPGDRYFFLVPQHKGGVMDIHHDKNIYMYDGYPHGGNNQIFYLGPKTSDGYYQIYSPSGTGALDMCLSSRTRDPFKHPSQSKNNIYFYNSTPHGGNNQLFKFKVGAAISYKNYTVPKKSTYRLLENVEEPHITNFTMTPRQYTGSNAVTIATGNIPFVFVNDWLYSRSSQVKETPYYKIIRKQYWNRVFYAKKLAGEEMTISKSFVTGVVNASTYSIEQTISVKWTAGGEATYSSSDSNSSKTASTLEQQIQVKITASNSTTVTQTDTLAISRKLPTDKRITYAIYEWVDLYILERMDGSVVTSWEIKPKNRAIEVIYDGTLTYEDEPNDTISTADGPVSDNIRVSGNLASTGTRADWFYFPVDTIKSIGFYLEGSYKSISVYRPGNTATAHVHFSQGSTTSGKSYTYTPIQTGTHYIKIDGYSGSYSFIINY